MQEPDHVSLDRMVEFAVDWNVVFTESGRSRVYRLRPKIGKNAGDHPRRDIKSKYGEFTLSLWERVG